MLNVHLNWLDWFCFLILVLLCYSASSFTCYPNNSNRLHDFPSTIPGCYDHVPFNSFFPHTTGLWNSLPADCFHLIHSSNGFKSKINRHFYLWVLSKQLSYVFFNFFFSCISMPFSSCSVLQKQKNKIFSLKFPKIFLW